jgi:hypothetical protein
MLGGGALGRDDGMLGRDARTFSPGGFPLRSSLSVIRRPP